MKLLVPLALLFLASCSNNKEGEQVTFHHDLGKYIYQDDNDVYHIDPHCIKLQHGKDDDGHEIYAKHMVDTTDFVIVKPQYFRVCARCVDDEDYEHILRISDANQTISAVTKRNEEFYRKWLYRRMIELNYDMGPYETFVGQVSKPENCKILYDVVLKEGIDAGCDFEEFSSLMGS